MTNEVLTPKRTLVGGKWHHVHVSADGNIQIDTGPDDQRPEHDGVTFFTPSCVAEIVSWGDDVWTYHYYCGACRRRIGSFGEVREFCSRCGKGIAHYVFSMGVLAWKSAYLSGAIPDDLPSQLPALNEKASQK